MTHNSHKPQRFVLHLGAAIAVTTIVPIADIMAKAATPAEKLAVLRTATNEGRLQLLRRAEDGTLGPVDPQGDDPSFEKSATDFDKK